MKPAYKMTRLEFEQAKLKEIEQQLRGLQMRALVGGLTPQDAKEYSRLRLARDVCHAAINQYSRQEAASHA